MLGHFDVISSRYQRGDGAVLAVAEAFEHEVLDPSFCFSLYYLGRATPVCFGSGGLALRDTVQTCVIPSVTNLTQVRVTSGSTSLLPVRLLLYNVL